MGLKIYLLGKFEVYHNDRLVQHWKSENDKILLKILLTEPGRGFSQDTLVEYLWPDLPLPQGIRNLRGRISELRKTLQPSLKRGARSPFIKTVPNGYVFDPKQCQIDAETFKGLCRQARRQDQTGRSEEAAKCYQEALEIYRGDFLPEDNHQEWAIAPRERFRQLSLEALERLVALLHQLHRCQEAIHYAERALLTDRYREGFYRVLMRCYADTGNPAEALRVYERCRQTLRELDAVPSQEIEQCYQGIHRQMGMENAKVEVEQALENLQHQLDATRDVKKRLELLLQQQKHLDYLGKRTEQLRALDDALHCAQALKDTRQLGWVYGKRAEYFRIIGDLAQARSSLEQARQQFQSIRDLNGIAWALSLLGTLNFDLGELDQAQTCYEKALSQLEELEGPDADRARLTAWSGLARIEARRRRYPEALAQYDRAYRLSQKLGDCTAQVSLLLNIGALHYRWDHPAEAGLHWEEARQLAHRIGDVQAETLCLNNLGLLRTNEGDLEGALALYERVISTQEQVVDRHGLAETCNNIGAIYDIMGQTERALEVYERSRQQDEMISNQLGIAISEMNMGGVYIEQRQYSKARPLLDKSLTVFEKFTDREWQAQALMRLGRLSQECKQHKKAVTYLERAISFAQEIESETLALECQSFLLVSKLALRQTEEAQALAEKMARRLEGSPPGYYLVAVNYRLYQAFCALGQSKRAERYLKRAYDDLLELYLGLKNAEFRKSFWRVRLHRQIRRARKGRFG